MDMGIEIWMGPNWNERGIWLFENPLKKPPIEIVRKGKKAIKAYFKSLEGEKQALNEVKVLLVGDGGAGKTSNVKNKRQYKNSSNDGKNYVFLSELV